MDPHRALQISDPSHPGEARRQAVALATAQGLGPSDAGRIALVVTEAATNVLKHAGKGQVLLRPLREAADRPGVEVLALDRGPGMADVARCMQDGYSTAGSPGTGLGAMSRLASTLEIYSAPSRGTALLARVLPQGAVPAAAGPLAVGTIGVPAPGETVSGDDWSMLRSGDRALVLVADGLGHGSLAAKAASEAVRLFEASGHLPLEEMFRAIHGALAATRGAAVSIAELDAGAREVRFAGVGNVTGFLAWPGGSRSMVTHSGTVGGHFGRARALSYTWGTGSLLVMHTDGLNSHASLDAYPGLLARHPTLVAAVLYRDFARGRDDATVVVVAERRARP